jgi:hypothetical protein
LGTNILTHAFPVKYSEGAKSPLGKMTPLYRLSNASINLLFEIYQNQKTKFRKARMRFMKYLFSLLKTDK